MSWGRGVKERGARLKSAVEESEGQLVQGGSEANTSDQRHVLAHNDRVEPFAEGELGFTHGFERIDVDLEGILPRARYTSYKCRTTLCNWGAVTCCTRTRPQQQPLQTAMDEGPLARQMR